MTPTRTARRLADRLAAVEAARAARTTTLPTVDGPPVVLSLADLLDAMGEAATAVALADDEGAEQPAPDPSRAVRLLARVDPAAVGDVLTSSAVALARHAVALADEQHQDHAEPTGGANG